MRLAPKRPQNQDLHAIPSFMFKEPRFREIFQNCVDGANLDVLDTNARWIRMKELVHMAAGLVRDELQKGICPPANAGGC